LQTVILGVDYLSNHVAKGDATAAMVLADMGNAVMKADAIIHGLLEFSSTNQREIKDEDLSTIVGQALQAVEHDAANRPIQIVKELGGDLPLLRLDGKAMKHVFINLLMHALREMPDGGKLLVRTFARELTDDMAMNGRSAAIFKAGETVAGAMLQESTPMVPGGGGDEALFVIRGANAKAEESGLGLTVLKKIVELYGGVLDMVHNREKGNQYTVLFKVQRKE